MAELRPDPEPTVTPALSDDGRARRGRLRIFFGAAPGVGKTYAMLAAARHAQRAGTEVVVGVVDTHGRPETERLLEGLEHIQALPVRHRGRVRYELDLDFALARHPDILLVDELAHVNPQDGVPAPRHPRRWQDIQELLAAGIHVWTTVNVEHLESLNDLIFQVTGLRPRQSVPDRIFDEADDIELIDLPPDDLIERLKAGMVSTTGHDTTATARVFRKQSLLALREIALRRVAARVEAASRALPAQLAAHRIAGERVLVAVGTGAQARQLVRAGKRIAEALHAPWTAVYVETPRVRRLPEALRTRRADVLRLAESLGGEAITLHGPAVAPTLIEYARARRATRVIVGTPKRRGWRAWLLPSAATELTQRAPGFDVIMIGQSEPRRELPAVQAPPLPPVRWEPYVWAGLVTLVCTALALTAYPTLDLPNIVMIYLAGVTIGGLRLGRGPSASIAIANAILFDFFFVPPRYELGFGTLQYVIMFGVMLCIALIVATLTDNVRQQTRVAGARERRTALLYAMSRELAGTRGPDDMAHIAVRHVAEVFQCQAVVLLPDAAGQLRHPRRQALPTSFRGADLAIAQWVADHAQRAGLGTDTLPGTPGLYIPLGTEPPAVGVLAVLPAAPGRALPPEQIHLLETFAAQIALALERAHHAEAAEAASLAVERESLRNTLLASISHDLRTPLSVIAGAASAMAQPGSRISEPERVELARSIETKAREMSELVSNVLELMRWQSGDIALRRDWQTLDDLVGAALNQVQEKLGARDVEIQFPPDLPAVHVDAQLIVQLFANLLDNIAKYTPEGTRVTLTAAAEGDLVRLTVDDTGPGLPAGDPARLFEKFQRGSGEGPVIGVGLGLAICRAIVRAHGGTIDARHRPGGGARFEFTLPARESA